MTATNLSLIKFLQEFDTEEKCREYLIKERWSSGVKCPYCESDAYTTNRGFRCKNKHCAKKFTAISGTMLANTKAPLKTWFFLMYEMAINRKNLSSIQRSKNLGTTQKTSWDMMRKIRECLAEDYHVMLSGIVEVDEVFVSKGNRWTRWGGISTRKAPVLGLIQRGGRVIIKLIDDRKRETINEIIYSHVEKGSTIYTDGYAGYKALEKDYIHEYVEHSTKEYVRGDVHTNTIENVWSLLKKAIRNAHHSVSNKHLKGYCDEVAFRLNYRDLDFKSRFDLILEKVLKFKHERHQRITKRNNQPVQ